VVAMHKQVDHPNFLIMFDTCHAYMCGVVGARQHGAREVLAGGVSESKILEDFPDLEAEDIRACLQYASAQVNHTVLQAV